MLQLGINVLWYVSSPTEPLAQVAKQAAASMNYIVSEDANSVNINFPFYAKGPASNLLYAGSGTPTPAQVAVVVEVAHKSGLRVTLRPLMDQTTMGAGWRGNIHPIDLNDWFGSYELFLKPYLVVAQDTGVSTFILGAEFNSLAADPQWSSLVNQANAVFHGQTAYSVNWDVFHSTSPDPPVDSLGVDAYDPVSVGPTASIKQLEDGINQWWATLPSRIIQSNTVIDELGIPAQNNAYLEPFAAQLPNEPLNLQIQFNWFTAYCQVIQARHLAGVYFWDLIFGENSNTVTQMMSFIGRPGARAIKSCFEKF
jgi:hypothetical protein